MAISAGELKRARDDAAALCLARPEVSQVGLLALGGSHAYGLASAGSDIDLRGFAFPTAEGILLGRDFGQVQSQDDIDICVYSLAKLCKLLAENNPNIIELLGLDEDSIIDSTGAYATLRSHPEWFLSKRAAHTFGGYATAQLRRLQNAMARDANVDALSRGTLRSMRAAVDALPAQYPHLAASTKIDLRLTDDERPEVRVTLNTADVRAGELASFARELDSARKSAEIIGKNRRKDSSKLAKHASHLIRLLHMGAEILETGEIRTRRTDDAQLLRDIKAGMWLSEDENGVRVYDDAFFDLLDESQKRFEQAEAETTLPEKADKVAIDDFLVEYHGKILKGDSL